MSELNLIPYHLKGKQDKGKRMVTYYKMGAVGLVILIFIIGFPKLILFGLNIQEAMYKRMVEEMSVKTIDQQIQEINNEIGEYRQYIDKVTKLATNKIISNDKISEINKYVPADIVFDELTYETESITIGGTTPNLGSVSGFAANLELSNNYKLVRINSIQSGTNENGEKASYKFIIKVEF